jgi:hypothetical protein
MIRKIAIVCCILWAICIFMLLNAEITIGKPKETHVVEVQPMMYTWDDGGQCP